jgi:hypothetical protein
VTLRAIDIAQNGSGGAFLNYVETDRQLIDALARSVAGVVFTNGTALSNCTDLQVTPAAGHNIQVNLGRAIVRNTTSPFNRGAYFVQEDAVETFSLPVPGANPFYATVVLRVTDPDYGTVSGTVGPRIDVIKGTEAGSPVAVSDATISAVANTPGGWIRLADVRVNTGDSGAIPSGQVVDRRLPGGFGGRISAFSNARPIGGGAGYKIYELDTGADGTWDATLSKWLMEDSRWQTYTPVWSTAGGGTPTLGAGGSIQGRYKRHGVTCLLEIWMYTGTTGFNGGVEDWKWTIPFQASPTGPWVNWGVATVQARGYSPPGCDSRIDPGLSYVIVDAAINAQASTSAIQNSDTTQTQGTGVPQFPGLWTWEPAQPGYVNIQIEYQIVVP